MTERDQDQERPDDSAATHPTDEGSEEEPKDDAAEESSEESFPASDAPAW